MKNSTKHILMVIGLTVFLPIVTSAQAGKVCAQNVDSITDILCKLGSYGNLLIPIMILIGLLYFVWGVVQYVIGGDQEAKAKGKDRIIYGLIGFVVIFAFKGLVSVIIDTFGISAGNVDYINTFVQNNNDIVSASTLTCNLVANPKLGDLFKYATCMINGSIIPLIFAVAVLMFAWGVVQYVINDSDEGKKQKGRDFMIWGLVGLVVMVGVWGIVKIVGGTFGIENTIPQLKDN